MKIKNWQHDAEYVQQIADLLDLPEIQRLQSITQHRYSNRLDHSLSVSYYSYLLGKKLHLDTRSLARGGLLHDLFYYDWDAKHLDFRTHAYVHAQLALSNARSLVSLSDVEEDIIVKHMFGATLELPRYFESIIVNLVDDYFAVVEALAPRLNAWKQKLQS